MRPASLVAARNQLPKPSTEKGLPLEVVRKVSPTARSARSIAARSTGPIGMKGRIHGVRPRATSWRTLRLGGASADWGSMAMRRARARGASAATSWP